MIVDGVEYVPSGEACDRLGVGVTTLRHWYHPRAGEPARVRLLRDPDGRPVRLHRQVMVCWPDAVEAEYATRSTARGRPRGAGTHVR